SAAGLLCQSAAAGDRLRGIDPHTAGIERRCARGRAHAHSQPARIPTSQMNPSRADMAHAPLLTANRILLADEDPLVVASVGHELRECGFEVREAFDSAAAFDSCLAHAPSLAILDQAMSGATGVELAHQIANHTPVPVILLSAGAQDDVVVNAVAAGALALLVKPVEPRQLLATVRIALQRGRDIIALRAQAEQLNTALQSGRSIGLVTGLLMARFRIGREE